MQWELHSFLLYIDIEYKYLLLKEFSSTLVNGRKYNSMLQNGDTLEQLKLLSIHRERLLDRVHREEKRIDCLDYLVYQIRKSLAAE